MAVSATTPGLFPARILAGIVSEVIRRITAPIIEGMVNLSATEEFRQFLYEFIPS